MAVATRSHSFIRTKETLHIFFEIRAFCLQKAYDLKLEFIQMKSLTIFKHLFSLNIN